MQSGFAGALRVGSIFLTFTHLSTFLAQRYSFVTAQVLTRRLKNDGKEDALTVKPVWLPFRATYRFMGKQLAVTITVRYLHNPASPNELGVDLRRHWLMNILPN